MGYSRDGRPLIGPLSELAPAQGLLPSLTIHGLIAFFPLNPLCMTDGIQGGEYIAAGYTGNKIHPIFFGHM